MMRRIAGIAVLCGFCLALSAGAAPAAGPEGAAPKKCLSVEDEEVPCDSPAAEERRRREAERERIEHERRLREIERERRERWEDIRGRGRPR